MIIKSISGKVIYKSVHKTVRATLEDGVEKGIDFSFADLRKARLFGAGLDGIRATGASFWGAELGGADIGLSDLRKADLRCVNLKDTCLAESDLCGADLRGAYFAGTILEGASLDDCRVSCPSFWDVDISSVSSLKRAVYSHKGEQDIPVDPRRWVLDGPNGRIVFNDNLCVWRGAIYRRELPAPLRQCLLEYLDGLQPLLGLKYSCNAKKPIPKIPSSSRAV